MNRVQNRLFTILLIALPIIFILLFEVVLRVVNYGGNLDLFVLKRTAPFEEFVLNENFTKRYFFHKGIKSPIPLSQTFPARKESSTYRIFCLGESTTQGFPYPPNAAYPALLQHILSGYFPDRKIQVINCGITAITSHSVLDMEREIIKKYQPDLLVITTGHNEFYGVFGQASNLSFIKNRSLLQLFLRLQRAKLFLLMRDVVNIFIPPPFERNAAGQHQSRTLMQIMAKDVSIDYGSDLYQKTAANYAENLIDMSRLARNHDVDVMLCSLVDNRLDQAPFGSKHCRDFAQKDTLQWHDYMNCAQTQQKAGQYQDAATYYQKALAIDSTYADTHFLLGQCYYALKESRRAQHHLLSAKNYDVIRFRAPSIFNTIMAQVAHDDQAPFADCENSFMERSPQGIVGRNFLLEHVHPNISGHLLIAQTIAETMKKNSLVSAQWDTTRTRSDSVYIDMCHLTTLDYEVAHYTLYRLMSQWPFPHVAMPVYRRIGNEKTEELAKLLVDGGKKSLVELHLDYGNEFHQANQFQQAFEEYTAALAIHPLAQTYDCLGRLFLRQTELAFRDVKDYNSANRSYRQGVSYFKQGLERWPQDVDLNYNLGLLYFMRADETDAAVSQFRQVLHLSPKHNKAYRLLSELYIRRHELAQAKTYLQKAIQLFPDDAYFYTNMGLVLIEENDRTAAERYLDQAVRMDGNAKAKYYLDRLKRNAREDNNH